jgi:membrane protein
MSSISSVWADTRALVRELYSDLRQFPWRNTWLTLGERFGEDRLAQTASSLTFSTLIALVPLFTVALAIFSALPVFDRMEGVVQEWLVKSLIPENIARTVLQYLQQFSTKAAGLGWTGGVVLLASALAVVLTIDNKLNEIWRVRRRRPFARRILMYWAALTLGPLILGISVTATTYLVSSSQGLVAYVPGGVRWAWSVIEFLGMVLMLAGLYRVVPNVRVRWSHALIGGMLAALTLELVKRLLAWYLAAVPSYSVIYGAFATLPILLIWIYLVWVVVLLGAVVTAYLPTLLAGIARRSDHDGWDFSLALEILAMLDWVRERGELRGLSTRALAHHLRVSDLQLERALDVLVSLHWVGQLDEPEARNVLLVDPGTAPLHVLAERLLLPRSLSTEGLWQRLDLDQVSMAQVLPRVSDH